MRRAWSVSVFARHEGAVLLIAHKRLGTWLPVGGEIEPGETPSEAARRELLEETGLVGEFRPLGGVDGTPPGLLGYEEHDAGSKGLHLNFAFVADVPSREVVSNGEFGAVQWVRSFVGVSCPQNVRELGFLALGGLEDVARRWMRAFNARELGELLALYAEDAVHLSPKLREREPHTEGRIVGKAALRAWWQGAMTRLPDLRYDLQHLTASGDRVFMDYVRVVPGEPDLRVVEVLVVQRGVIQQSWVFHG